MLQFLSQYDKTACFLERKFVEKKFLVHRGKKITLEWYFDKNGNSKVRESFMELSLSNKKKLTYIFLQLGERGRLFNKEKFRNEGDKIYAIKASQDRFLCFFFDGTKIIITNAYKKKSNKMPKDEKEKALKAKKNYVQRCKEGTYYE